MQGGIYNVLKRGKPLSVVIMDLQRLGLHLLDEIRIYEVPPLHGNYRTTTQDLNSIKVIKSGIYKEY